MSYIRWGSLVLVILVVVNILFLSAAEYLSTNRSTQLTVNPSVIELGLVREGEVKQFHFTVVNSTAYEANFLEIAVSCGCTMVDLPETRLSPGDSLVITGQFDAARKRGKAVVPLVLAYDLGGIAFQEVLEVRAETAGGPAVASRLSDGQERVQPLPNTAKQES